jgi:quinol monooxygenase YgiN
MPGELAAADHDLGYQRADGRYGDAGAEAGHPDGYGELDRLPATPARAAPAQAATETRQAELFGQIAIYTVLEDRVDEFDQLTGRIVEQVRSREPDTLVFIVHAVPSAPMQRILYEVYRDRAAYQRHSQQPYVRQFEADRRPYVLATNVIELGLQQAKVSPFPSVADLFGEPGYDTSGFERPDFLRDYGRTSGQHDAAGGRDFR